MWLIPSTSCPSAPGSDGSTLESAPPLNTSDSNTGFWVTSSGTPTLRPASWRGWKTRAWSQRLFGAATSKTWTEAACAVGLISSSPASPASRGRRRARKKGQTIPVGSGRLSFGSLCVWNPELASWKMCQVSFLEEDSNTSSPTLPKQGSMRSGAICGQPLLALRTAESESSSWPTPNTMPEAPNGGLNRGNGEMRARTTTQCLGELAEQWPTPTAGLVNDGESPKTWELRREKLREKGINGNGCGTPLTIAAQTWPSPKASEGRSTTSSEEAKEAGFRSLTEETELWATPRSHEVGGWQRDPHGNVMLTVTGQAEAWPTPTAQDCEQAGSDNAAHFTLNNAATTWATPAATDDRRGNTGYTEKQKNRPDGAPKILNHQVSEWSPTEEDRLRWAQNNEAMDACGFFPGPNQTSSHQVPSNTPNGDESLQASPISRRRLNPAFVCLLMGAPWWWTRAEPINFAAQEMAVFRSKVQQRLSSLCGGR